MECGTLVLGVCLSRVYGCRIPGEDMHRPGGLCASEHFVFEESRGTLCPETGKETDRSASARATKDQQLA